MQIDLSKKFIWAGCQSPHIFDESASRWIAASIKYPKVHFFLADADHVGSWSNDKPFVATHDFDQFYSAMYHYFPFFGKLGRLNYEEFISQYSLPRNLCTIVLKDFDDEIKKRDKFFLMPLYDRDDTIRSIGVNNDLRALIGEFYSLIISDIKNILVTDEQKGRLENVMNCLNDNFNSFESLSNLQYQHLLSLLKIKTKVEVHYMSDYFHDNKSFMIKKIEKFKSNYSDNAKKYNYSIREFSLPYRALDLAKNEMPFLFINRKSFKREGLTLDNFDPESEEHFFVGRHAFLIASFSSPELNSGSLYLGGPENTPYHQLTDFAAISMGTGESETLVWHQPALFFNYLSTLNDPIKTPLWLQGGQIRKIETCSEFIGKILELIEAADKQLQDAQGKMGLLPIITHFCTESEVDQYRDMKNQIKHSLDESRRNALWETFWQYQSELIKKSFYNWARYKHISMLTRFQSRGAHLIWLYVIAGENAARQYLDNLGNSLL